MKKNLGFLTAVLMILTLLMQMAAYAGTDDDGVFISEDFENVSSVTDLYSSGWAQHRANKGTPQIVDSGDDGHGKVLQLNQNGQGICATIPENSGKIEIELSVCTQIDEAKLLLELTNSYDFSSDGIAMIAYYDGFGNIQPNSSVNSPLTACKAYYWLDYKVTINADDKTFSVEIYRDSEMVGSRYGVSYSFDDLKSLRIRDWANSNVLIDDVTLRYADESTIVDKDENTFIAEDFEKATSVSNLYENGWGQHRADAGNPQIVSYGGEEHGKVLLLDRVSQGICADIKAADGSLVTNGKIELKFQVCAGIDDAKFIMEFVDGYTVNANYSVIAYYDGYGNIQPNTSVNSPFAKYTAGGWLDFDVILDAGSRTFTVTVSKDGTVIGTRSDGVNAFDMSAFRIRNWASSNIYIDNVYINYYIGKPALSDNTVSMLDASGGTVTDFVKPVTPAVKAIKFDFMTKLDQATLDGAISFSSSSSEVSYTADYDNGVYTIYPDKFLAPDTVYTIVCSGSIANISGTAMGSDYVLEFTTASPFVYASVSSVSKGNIEIDNISSISEGNRLKVCAELINCTPDTAPLTVVIAYFDGNRFVGFDFSETDCAYTGDIALINADFTAPDMTDVNRIEIYLWKGLLSPFAYNKIFTLE